MVIVMTVVNAIKYRKIIKLGINIIMPVILLIYSTTILLDPTLVSNVVGNNLVRYQLTIISSVGISILILILFYISRVFPKNSFKRSVNLFGVSLLMLIDGYIWAKFSFIEVVIEDIGSFSVDSTFLFKGLIVFLSLNVFLKGLDLFSSTKEVISKA